MSHPSTTSHDSLPYLDAAPTPQERIAAEDMISAHLPLTHHKALHPSLRPLPEPNWPSFLSIEIFRKAADPVSKMANGIDMSRYEPPSTPPSLSSTSGEDYKKILQQAYASHTYLHLRAQNLSLLEENGKNAWLIANSRLENELAMLEREAAEVNGETEEVNRSRKQMQEDNRGELEGLATTWREGVGRAVEVQVALTDLGSQRGG